MKSKLFSVSIKDCDVQTFTAGGKGGQHQNRTETGVRVIHRPSGAVGEARDSRSQLQNKKAAFGRMARSVEFQRWVHRQGMMLSGELDAYMASALAPGNVRTEVWDGQGWVDV